MRLTEDKYPEYRKELENIVTHFIDDMDFTYLQHMKDFLKKWELSEPSNDLVLALSMCEMAQMMTTIKINERNLDELINFLKVECSNATEDSGLTS